MSYVYMDFSEVERMVTKLRVAGEELQEVEILIARVSDVLDDGALLGEAGSLLSDSMRNELIHGIFKLREKLDEMADDVNSAMLFLRDGDSAAKSRFTD